MKVVLALIFVPIGCFVIPPHQSFETSTHFEDICSFIKYNKQPSTVNLIHMLSCLITILDLLFVKRFALTVPLK